MLPDLDFANNSASMVVMPGSLLRASVMDSKEPQQVAELDW